MEMELTNGWSQVVDVSVTIEGYYFDVEEFSTLGAVCHTYAIVLTDRGEYV